jgi:hypothetical protein
MLESLLCAFAREFWTRPLFLIDSLVGLTIHYRILTCWIDDTLPNPVRWTNVLSPMRIFTGECTLFESGN